MGNLQKRNKKLNLTKILDVGFFFFVSWAEETLSGKVKDNVGLNCKLICVTGF